MNLGGDFFPKPGSCLMSGCEIKCKGGLDVNYQNCI